MTKNYHLTAILSVLILAIAMIFGNYLVSQTSFVVKNNEPTKTLDGTLTHTISVSGQGKVYATPDMVTLNISASELARTTKEAQQKVNDKIKEVLDILTKNGVPEKDIQTAELSLYPEYDWSITPKYLKGQRATQRLTVQIKKIDPKAEKVSTIIDLVSAINTIEMNGISFDIEDKTPLFSQARELAFKKAEQKATELARLGKVQLEKPVSISDVTTDYYPPLYGNINQYSADSRMVQYEGGSQLPTGQLEVSVSLQVLWGIE